MVPAVVSAEFFAEARDLRGLPPEGAPEVAISGRSNVGKSTLLNRLAGRKSLARISKTPGRTRGIVFFDLALSNAEPGRGARLRLVDLPGYGYAQVSHDERRSWQPLIEGYTKGRRTLALFIVLVDARRGLQDEEAQLVKWLVTSGVRHQVVVTKVDKLNTGERGALRARLRTALPISGATGEGVDQLWRIILSAVAASTATA